MKTKHIKKVKPQKTTSNTLLGRVCIPNETT